MCFDQFDQIRHLFRLAQFTKTGPNRPKSALALLKTGVPHFEKGQKGAHKPARSNYSETALREIRTYDAVFGAGGKPPRYRLPQDKPAAVTTRAARMAPGGAPIVGSSNRLTPRGPMVYWLIAMTGPAGAALRRTRGGQSVLAYRHLGRPGGLAGGSGAARAGIVAVGAASGGPRG